MKYLPLLVLFCSGLVFAAKPMAPVALDFQFVEDISSGYYQIELNVTNRGATAQYDVELQLPPGAQLISGELTWSGELTQFVKESFLYEIAMDSEYYVDVYLKSGSDGSLVIHRRFNIITPSGKEILFGIESSGEARKSKERIRGPYIEYPLQ